MSASTVNNLNDPSQQAFEPLDVMFDRIDERFFAQVADLRLMPEWTPPAGPDGGHFLNPRDGGSMEFKQHRGYAPGDDVRRVDWAVYGRTKKLFTRMVEAEHTPELVIAIDRSASMEADKADGKFGRALELALLMAYVALNSDYQVQLVPFGPSPSEEVGQSIRLVHPSQIFGLAKSRLLNWRPEGQTNFEQLGDQSLRWRRAGASVVVLSDFLIDVDDEAISHGPQNPSWFRPLAAQNATFAKARHGAQQRILASLSQLHQAFTPLKTPNVRAVLLSMTAAGETSLAAARSIFDVETGFLRRVLFTRASEQAYQAAHRAHSIAMDELAKDLGLAHVNAAELINRSNNGMEAAEPLLDQGDRELIERIILGLALGPHGIQSVNGGNE